MLFEKNNALKKTYHADIDPALRRVLSRTSTVVFVDIMTTQWRIISTQNGNRIVQPVMDTEALV